MSSPETGDFAADSIVSTRSLPSSAQKSLGTIVMFAHLVVIEQTEVVIASMEQVKSKRGFASMDRARQRAIASKGGHGVPPEKRSFSKNRELAALAGRKGGEAVPASERSFSQNRELAAAAGRKGGESRALLFGSDAQHRDREHPDERDEQKHRDEEDEETESTAKAE